MIYIDWPMFAFDLRLILWPIAVCLATLWFLKSLRTYRYVKSNPAFRNGFFGKFQPWYMHAQIWLFPVFKFLGLFAGGKVPNWLVRLGKSKSSP